MTFDKVAYMAAYHRTNEYRRKQREWRKLPEIKERIHIYETSEARREQKREFDRKPERKLQLKIRQKKFFSTEYGKAVQAYWTAKRRKYLKSSDTHITVKEWLEIRNRSPLCPMCGKFVGCENLTLDHIIPLSKGGKNKKENVQALCLRCNILKSDKIPIEVDSNA